MGEIEYVGTLDIHLNVVGSGGVIGTTGPAGANGISPPGPKGPQGQKVRVCRIKFAL